MVTGLTMDANWNSLSTGSEVAGINLSGRPSKIWLRAYADIRPGSGRTATLYYSTDGAKFHSIVTPYSLNNTWQFFIGYRYGIFNYATVSLGGSVLVSSFEMESGAPAPGTTPTTTA